MRTLLLWLLLSWSVGARPQPYYPGLRDLRPVQAQYESNRGFYLTATFLPRPGGQNQLWIDANFVGCDLTIICVKLSVDESVYAAELALAGTLVNEDVHYHERRGLCQCDAECEAIRRELEFYDLILRDRNLPQWKR